jgi:DNA-binding NtrC family response regulator
MTERILIVEDEEVLARSIAQFLSRRGFTVETAPDGEAALERLGKRSFDAVATDIKMPHCDGLQLLTRMKEIGCSEPVIVLSAYGTFEAAVDAMKLGALDFLRKPIDLEQLEVVLRRTISLAQTRRELAYLRQRHAGSEEFPAPIGESAAIRAIRQEVERLAGAARGLDPGESPAVLITGETGTGKGLVVRYYHRLASEDEAPFIEVNCTNLQAGLIESELFGHERGAFTDAKTSRKGLVEAAEGGTLYLDEIGHLDPGIQGNLLTAIEEKTIRRLGGTDTRRVRVRIVASTNADLETAMREGRFRSDLFYRLATFRITVPPLRERNEDIECLAAHFLKRLTTKYGGPPRALGKGTFDLLRSYDWPGNVRELRNILERAVVLAPGVEILPAHLPGLLRPGRGDGDPTEHPGRLPGSFLLPEEGIDFEELESRLLDQALVRSAGNVAAAARLLGMSRSRFRYRLKRRDERAGPGP